LPGDSDPEIVLIQFPSLCDTCGIHGPDGEKQAQEAMGVLPKRSTVRKRSKRNSIMILMELTSLIDVC
jgi:hypothetical protein